MANSYTEYVAGTNANGTSYSITISSIFTAPSYLPGRGATDIVVTVDSVVQPSSAFTLNGTSVTFTSGNLPTTGQIVRVTRNSSQGARLNDYSDASLLTADALDQDANQLFFIAQEALDTASETNLAAGTFYFATGTQPDSTVAGTLWYDTSSTPNILKVYNGSEWEITSPVTTKAKYSNGGTGGTTAVVVGSGAYQGKSYFVDTAFNSKAEVYLNGVKLLNATSLASIPQYGDYFYDSTTNKVYFVSLGSSDILEVVTHSGSFNTFISNAEEAAAASASAAAQGASSASTQAGIASTKAVEAAASAVTAAAQVPLATAQKTAAVNAKTAAESAQTAAEAARDDSSVQTVATNLANGATSTIKIVSDIKDEVLAVADLSTELGIVSETAYKNRVTTVGGSGYKAKVSAVSDIVTEVTTVSDNITAVQGASANASTATTKAQEAAASAATATTQAGIATTKAGEATTTLASAVKNTGNESIAGNKTFTSKTVFSNASNNTNVELVSTDDDAASGPNLNLKRDSASPASGDILGVVNWTTNVTNGQGNIIDSKYYSQMLAILENSLDGNEGTQMQFKARANGAMANYLSFKPVSGTSQWETVFNETSRDIDFRVEGQGKAHALFVRASNGKVGIGNDNPTRELDVIGNIGLSGTLFTKDLNLSDTSPTIRLVDTDDTGAGTLLQNGTELLLKSEGVDNVYGSVLVRTQDGNATSRKRIEVTNDGDFKVYREDGELGLFLDESTRRLGVNKTENPQATLDVAGNGKFSEGLEVGGNILGGTTKATKSGQTPLISDRLNTTGTMFEGRIDGASQVRLGYNGLESYITSPSGGLRISGTAVKPTISGFNSNDDAVDLGTPTAQFKTLYLSDGISFGNTPGSITSKNLDDYEEGTWTPTYTTTSPELLGAINYDSDTRGYYTKIGNQVFVHGRVKTTSFNAGTSGGAVRIGGLPYPTASTGTQASGNCTIGRAHLFNGYMPIAGQVLNNNNQISLIKQTGPTANQTTFGVSLMTTTEAGNDTAFSAMYWTNS